MNRPITSILGISLFFFLWNSIPLYAQVPPSNDWILSMLRGKWDRISFYDQSTLLFLSDTKVVVDGDPMQYTLIPGGVRISSKDGSIDYPYVLAEDQLTVNFPEGDVRTYRRTESGTSERLLNGKYYGVDSTISGELISFDGERGFHLYFSSSDSSGEGVSAGVISEDGTYRVAGDMAILTFIDGTTDRAIIRFYDADGFVMGVIFHDQLYAKETPVVTIVPAPPPVGYAPVPGPCPGPYPPDPFPYPPGGPTPTPTTKPPSGGQPSTPIREFGNTRGDAGKSGDRTSPPTRAPSRDSGNTRADIGKTR